MSLETTKKIMEEKEEYKLDHLSHSQSSQFVKCPTQWKNRYLEGLKIVPDGALALGSSNHSTHEFNNHQKIDSHNDLPTPDITEYFAEDWDQRIKNEEVIFGDKPEEKPGYLKDTGISILKQYYPKYSQSIQPIMVEQKFEIEFNNVDWKFVVIADNVTSQRIIDYKTAGKKPSDEDIWRDNQPTANIIANKFAINDGVDRSFRFDYQIKNKNPYIYQVETVRTQEDIDNYLAWLDTIAKAIKQAVQTGIFIKNTGGWWCSKKWCGFFDRCKPYSKRIISI